MVILGRFMYSSVFFFKQKTAYEMRISDWSSDVCSSDLLVTPLQPQISASSESAATAALGSAAPPPEAKDWPKISMSRSSETSSCFLSRSKYQLPSAVSP